MKDVPVINFKIALAEINERLRVCLALSQFVEEASDLENTFGKSLVKLGSQSIIVGKSEWLPNYTSLWETIFKMSTVLDGKQHLNLAASVSQNICKTFPEHVKASKKRLQALSLKIFNQIDELKKAKLVNHKNLEKYHKLIQETEAALRNRDSANDTELKQSVDYSSSGTGPPAASAAPTADSSFMNRSLSKMLSKIAPEKKTQDRCRDLLRELDMTESSIVANTRRLNVCRTELLFDMGKALREVEEVDEARAALLKEGLSRYTIAQDLLINKQAEAALTVSAQTGHLDPVEEMAAVRREVEKACQLASAALRRKDAATAAVGVTATDEDAVITATAAPCESEILFAELFCRAEKICEVMESFRMLAVRSTSALQEIADTQRNYSKTAIKLLEKHGFGSATTTSAGGSCAEVLAQSESPATREGWEAYARSLFSISDLHVRAAEILSEEVCQRLDLVQKRVDIGRRELADKLSTGTKKYEAAHANAEKLTAKLHKLQALLKERRATLKATKENAASADAGSVPPIPSISELEESDSEGPDVAATATANKERKSSVKMMQGLESFGANLRNGKLKQVVGLENPADRAARIEKQIAGLEEEERELVDTVKAASLAAAAASTSVETELTSALNNAQELLQSDMETIRGAAQVVVRWHAESDSLARAANQSVKMAQEQTDLASDLLYFASVVAKVRQEGSAAAEGELLEIPAVEVFEPVRSELVEEERRAVASAGHASGGFASVVHAATAASHAAPTPSLVVPVAAQSSPTKLRTISEAASPATSPEQNSPARAALTTAQRAESSTVTVEATTAVAVPVRDPVVDREAAVKESPTSPSVMVDPLPAASLSAKSATATATDSPVASDLPSPPSSVMGSPLSADAAVAIVSRSDSLDATASQSAVPQPPAPISSPGASHVLHEVSSPSGSKYQEPQVVTELSKFGLSAADKVLESFSCALYPKKGLLTHGRMFITQHFLAFSGWPDTRVLLQLSQVRKIDKCNTLGYIPNAISVGTDDGEEYFFGSFIDRMQCFALLTNLSEIAKRIVSIQGSTFVADPRPLEFGYQSRNNIFGVFSTNTAAAEDDSPQPGTADSRTLSSESAFSIDEQPAGSRSSKKIAVPPVDRAVRAGSAGIELMPLTGSGSNSSLSQLAAAKPEPAAKRPKKTKKVAAPRIRRPSMPKMEMFSADRTDGVSLSTLYGATGITPMLDKTFDFPACDLWKAYFLNGSGYGDFLLSEGDLFIETGEWQPLTRPVAEDVSKLPFAFSRPFAYSHPRTTMLMFGPKNAPATQVQYLYLPCDMTAETLQSVRPRRGLVLNITQFDGIPMADVFKVMQYWSFEAHPDDSNRTVVRIGLAMHYIKSSLFKSQIFGGTRDELTDQLKKWFVFVESRVVEYQRSTAALVDITSDGHISSGGEGADEEEDEEESVASEESGAEADRDSAQQHRQHRRMSREPDSRRASPRPSATRPTPFAVASSTAPPQSSPAASATTSSVSPSPPQQQGVSPTILMVVIAVLVLVVLLQWWSSRSVAYQLSALAQRLDASQKASEVSSASTAKLLEKLVAHIGSGK